MNSSVVPTWIPLVSWDRTWPLSLLSEKPLGDFIYLRMVPVLLILLLLLYSSLSYLPVWLFSGFHLPF